MQDVYTTGQAAKICRLTVRTVSKCADDGFIKGVFRIPGSKARRIPHKGLRAFIKEYGLSPDPLFLFGVLLVTQDGVLRESLEKLFPVDNYRIVVATNAFNAGMAAETSPLGAAIVDFSIGSTEALLICQGLRVKNPKSQIVAITPGACLYTQDTTLINRVFEKKLGSDRQFNPQEIAAYLQGLAS